MEIQEQDLVDLIKAIWSSLIGLDIRELAPAPQLASDEPVVSACVDITGAWRGTVGLICAESTARKIAQAMFNLSATGASSEEVGDCIGELANVIAGNVKAASMMPGDVSLPRVEFGPRADFETPNSLLKWMVCDGDAIAVGVAKPSDGEIATNHSAPANHGRNPL